MNILFISLGCDKNLVDTEVMLGMLASRGYQMVEEETQADVIVINTCCFVHDAKEESIQNILEMAEYKKEGRLKALIVTGCLAQRYRQEILDEIPEVDAVLGTTAYDKILDAIDEALKGAPYTDIGRYRSPSRSGDKTSGDYGRSFCVSENRRRVRQALYVLYYSKDPWKFPECADGAAPVRSRISGRTRGKGTDSGCTGDNLVRKRSLW